MSVFAYLELEPIVQVDDRTRLSAVKSFATQDESAISMVEIDPGTGTFVDVTPDTATDSENYYLDYQFSSAGSKTIRARITAGSTVNTVSKTITVLSVADDALFASDADLATAEPDVLQYVKSGRNTFKDIHRAAQDEIIQYLNEQGYTDSEGDPLTKDAIVDFDEVKLWSKYTALRMIYEGLSNAVDDIYAKKAAKYDKAIIPHRNKVIIRLDVDGDGEVDTNEGIGVQTCELFKR